MGVRAASVLRDPVVAELAAEYGTPGICVDGRGEEPVVAPSCSASVVAPPHRLR
jgi:hypothetical protein